MGLQKGEHFRQKTEYDTQVRKQFFGEQQVSYITMESKDRRKEKQNEKREETLKSFFTCNGGQRKRVE